MAIFSACKIKARNDAQCRYIHGHTGDHSWKRHEVPYVMEPKMPPPMTEEELIEYRRYVPRDDREDI